MTASMVILLAPVLDRDLLPSQSPWLDMAYTILDEMISLGQLQAFARKQELQRLQQVFREFPLSLPISADVPDMLHGMPQPSDLDDFSNALDGDFIDDAIWRTDLTAEQLMAIADTLDLDGFEWMTADSVGDSTNMPD